MSNLSELRGNNLYIICKYNSSLPNSDSIDLFFFFLNQRIIIAYIVSLVQTFWFWLGLSIAIRGTVGLLIHVYGKHSSEMEVRKWEE